MRTIHKSALLGSAAALTLLTFASGAWAQTAPSPRATTAEPETASDLGDVVVVGSQIRGAAVNTALPVTVLDEEQILATGAVNGDDLMRSIPQMGDVLFSAANNPQTSNAARGDVNSVNLRSLGVGNTLVLLNGRRIVQHPTSQGTSDTGTVPVLSYNSNAIPVSGLRRVEVLMDGGEPVGGRWNYDPENRESPPKKQKTLGLPGPYHPDEDDIDAQVRRDLDEMNLPTVGVDGPRLFAVTPAEAEQALAHFIEHRLPSFGRFEDAIMADDWAMAHSLLSVPLNLGVLHPLDAVRAAEQAYRTGSAPLPAVEGFIRQILGWREYMWHLYWQFGPDYVDNNALHATTPLPDWWTNLDSDAVTAACLRDALAGVRDRGWNHHIERLMVLGNHALQRGYDPRALTEWFATAYVDGYRWVMPTNVIGMSQHADGGMLATKPYASGGAYLNKMSNHCGGCAYDPKKRLGDDACPFTAGYWAFVHRNRDLLAKNNRTVRSVASMDRLADLDAVLEQEADRDRF